MSSEAHASVNAEIIQVIRNHYQTDEFIPLHAPCVGVSEKAKLNACIDSTFVSSVGQFVGDFEQQFIDYTGAKDAIAVVNGTMGLFLALKVIGVQAGDLVLTQSLTFVATPNAISMLGAKPCFLDVDADSYSLSVAELRKFLSEQTYQKDQQCFHNTTHQRIAACVPMHTLGFVADIAEIVQVCHEHHLLVVEDAAESLGSFYQNQHSGTIGDIGVFSFNGNKIITTGGGGMLVTNNPEFAKKARHLSTTAKVPHAWLFEHDEIGYNLRMPNINAALGVAQFEQLHDFLTEKTALASYYQQALHQFADIQVMQAKPNTQPNYWLNGLLFNSLAERDAFLQQSNAEGVQTRPLWTPMHQLQIYQSSLQGDMTQTESLAQRIVNIPSGVICSEVNDA